MPLRDQRHVHPTWEEEPLVVKKKRSTQYHHQKSTDGPWCICRRRKSDLNHFPNAFYIVFHSMILKSGVRYHTIIYDSSVQNEIWNYSGCTKCRIVSQ